MDSENIRLAYKIESGAVTGVTVNVTHPANVPLPSVGDHVFLAPDVDLADTYAVVARSFIYSNRGAFVGAELTVGART